MNSRILLPAFAGGILAAALGVRAAELTEKQAVERALGRAAVASADEGRVGAAQAVADEAGLWPNPELSAERERVGGGERRSTDTVLRLTQRIDISGRRALAREAALRRVDAARLERKDRRLAIAAEVRRGFAELLSAQEQRSTLARWRERLDSALQVTARLVEQGEAAGYDRRRLEREVEAARLRAQAADADEARARETLASWVDEEPARLRAAGSLVPADAPPMEALLAGLESRPDLAAMRAQLDAFEREGRAARRAWIPEIGVGVGRKRVEDSARGDSGLVLSLSAPLPLWDRGQAASERVRFEAQAVRAEHDLKLSQARGQLRGAWQQARALREAAGRAATESLAGSRELSRIAETAYRGGEASLLELLDAYRAELDAQTAAIDLALRARLARIELDTLSGTE